MALRFVAGLLAAVLLVPLVTPARADIDPEQVRTAIERAVAYLKRGQNTRGAWPDFQQSYEGGTTALCALALLNAGVEPADDKIQSALAYLRGLKPSSTYVTSLQTMVFCAAEPQRDLLLIRRNAKWLEETQIKSGSMAGAWSYPHARGD